MPRLQPISFFSMGIRPSYVRSEYKPDFEAEIAALDEHWQGRTTAVMLRHTKDSMIARAIRLLLASGFLVAVAHVAPVAERAALVITRVEDLAPEAIARPLGKIRSACRIDRLSHRLESPSESGDACGRGEPSSDVHAQPPGTLPNPALTPGYWPVLIGAVPKLP